MLVLVLRRPQRRGMRISGRWMLDRDPLEREDLGVGAILDLVDVHDARRMADAAGFELAGANRADPQAERDQQDEQANQHVVTIIARAAVSRAAAAG